MAKILVVDDELSMREFLQILFQNEGHDTVTSSDVSSALQACQKTPFDLVISDLKLPDGSGLEVLSWVSEHQAETQVILLTAYASTQNAVEAMRLGAYDYQIKPVKVDEIKALSEKALEKVRLLRENRELSAELRGSKLKHSFVVQSPKMARILKVIRKVALANTSVLVEGESGTGKELVSRAIHEGSLRQSKKFIAINCGAIPDSLIESELFGHRAGSFTGAIKDRPGLFEAADQGTLLLDEVGELPLSVQVKLLRILQERSVRRIGDEVEHKVDVRIIAATNRDLEEMVKIGTFRQDLFYRLNVVKILVPALRERREDIPVLAQGFVLQYAKEMNKPIREISRDAMNALCRYSFPGNVRELENYIQRAVTLASGKVIGVDDFPDQIAVKESRNSDEPFDFPEQGIDLEERLKALERRYIDEALKRSSGVKKHAARLLGLSFRSFRYRIQKLGHTDSKKIERDETEELN